MHDDTNLAPKAPTRTGTLTSENGSRGGELVISWRMFFLLDAFDHVHPHRDFSPPFRLLGNISKPNATWGGHVIYQPVTFLAVWNLFHRACAGPFISPFREELETIE